MIKTRFLTSGCFWLVVETRHCLLIISLCILEVLREHKGGDCISTGKKCVCVCVCAQWQRREGVGQREMSKTASLRRWFCHWINVPVLSVPRRSSECYWISVCLRFLHRLNIDHSAEFIGLPGGWTDIAYGRAMCKYQSIQYIRYYYFHLAEAPTRSTPKVNGWSKVAPPPLPSANVPLRTLEVLPWHCLLQRWSTYRKHSSW